MVRCVNIKTCTTYSLAEVAEVLGRLTNSTGWPAEEIFGRSESVNQSASQLDHWRHGPGISATTNWQTRSKTRGAAPNLPQRGPPPEPHQHRPMKVDVLGVKYLEYYIS